jgi:hypothetical protein
MTRVGHSGDSFEWWPSLVAALCASDFHWKTMTKGPSSCHAYAVEQSPWRPARPLPLPPLESPLVAQALRVCSVTDLVSELSVSEMGGDQMTRKRFYDNNDQAYTHTVRRTKLETEGERAAQD